MAARDLIVAREPRQIRFLINQLESVGLMLAQNTFIVKVSQV